MTLTDKYLHIRWTKLLDSVKSYINANDAYLYNSELCRKTWESYAFCHWTNNPLASQYEIDLVQPGCKTICSSLSDFELSILLAWNWHEYLEFNNTGVEYPWQMSVEARRTALTEILLEAIYSEAAGDGAECEERQWFSEEDDDNCE